jgi:hypothetical protein
VNPTKLTSIVQQYHKKADRLVTRHTDEKGVFDSRVQPVVDYYRDAAAAVARLADGLETGDADFSGLEVAGGYAQKFAKVTTRDKAATPQEEFMAVNCKN